MAILTRILLADRLFFAPVFTISVLLACGTLGSVSPARAERGQWTPLNQLYDWGIATHLVLLRGDGNPHHSRVVSWPGFQVYGWQPGSDGCGSWPGSFTLLGEVNPSANMFCAGQSQLASGKLMTLGGETGLNWGIRDALIFTSGAGGTAGSWTELPEMSQARWYPTVTALADHGRVLASAGQKYGQLWLWGGKRDGAPPTTATGHLLHRFGRGAGGTWDPSVTPLDQGGERPDPRQGHTIGFLVDRGQQALFGGRDGAGSLVDEVVWLLKREDGASLDADYTYEWERLQLATGSLLPRRRTEHIAVAISATEMVVFGGLGKATIGQADTVLSDFWRLHKNPIDQQWRWAEVTVTSGTPPSARYGHAAAFAGGMLHVFGGAEVPGGDPQDSRVYTFEFTSAGIGNWSELEIDPASRVPQPRMDHAMVVDVGPADMIVYSGRLLAAAPSDTLWRLRYT